MPIQFSRLPYKRKEENCKLSFLVNFTGLNDLKALNSNQYLALNDGADIREITRQLVDELSNEAARVFGYDKIMVKNKWLQITWDISRPISVYYNAGIYSATGTLIYNPLFLANVVNAFGKETLVGILSHEVGHRMVYLLLTQNKIKVRSWQNELCADYIAGLLMRLGKCSINGMIMFYLKFCANGGETHPPGRMRVEAFKKGYTMIDEHTETSLLRTPFLKSINTKLILTKDFMRRRLNEDILQKYK